MNVILLICQVWVRTSLLLQELPELSGTHVESTSWCLCRGVLLDREC